MKTDRPESLVLAIGAGMLQARYSAPFYQDRYRRSARGILNGLSSWEFWAMAVTATLGTCGSSRVIRPAMLADQPPGSHRPQNDPSRWRWA